MDKQTILLKKWQKCYITWDKSQKLAKNRTVLIMIGASITVASLREDVTPLAGDGKDFPTLDEFSHTTSDSHQTL